MSYLTRSTLNPSASVALNGTGVGGAWSPPTQALTVSLPAHQTQAGELYTLYGKKTDHECSNYQKSFSVERASHQYCRSSTATPSTYYYKYDTDWPGRYWYLDAVNGFHSFEWDGNGGLAALAPAIEAFTPFVDSAIENLLPGIKPSLSLPNALFELKDLRKLPELISKFKFALGTLPRLKSWVQRPKKQSLKMITGLGADAYLTDQFAIRPLWSDLSNIIDAMTNYREMVDDLLANEGKIRKSHWIKPVGTELDLIPDTESHLVPSAGVDFYGGRLHKRVITYPEAPTFRAQLVYKYRFSEYQRLLSRELGMMDALGINLNPAHIWNAIPFSFIVDWVVKIGDSLNRMQMRNMEPITDIIRFSWSFKVRRKIEMFSHISVGGPVGTGECKVGETVESFYYRRPGLPSYNRTLQVTGLNFKQITLGGAIAGGTWSKRR